MVIHIVPAEVIGQWASAAAINIFISNNCTIYHVVYLRAAVKSVKPVDMNIYLVPAKFCISFVINLLIPINLAFDNAIGYQLFNLRLLSRP